jgi:chitodextrinase
VFTFRPHASTPKPRAGRAALPLLVLALALATSQANAGNGKGKAVGRDDVSPSPPGNVRSTANDGASVTFAWDAASDNVAVAGYRVYRGGIQVDTTSSLEDTVAGLGCGTSYELGVAAYDKAGNLSATIDTATSSCAGSADSQPPGVPEPLTATVTSSWSVSLSWPASEDDVGVAGYRLYRDGSEIATTTGLDLSDSGLAPGTTYSYSVVAFDAAGNTSVPATASATTFAASTSWTYPLHPFTGNPVWDSGLPAEAPLLSNSSEIVRFMLANGGFANANLSLRGYTIADAVVKGGERRYDVPCTTYACDLSKFGPIPIPTGAQPSYGSDAHLAIYDPATSREWDLWGAAYDSANDRWTAKSGTARDLTLFSDTIGARYGAVSVNWPALAGLVYPEELEDAKVVDHPLTVALPSTVVSKSYFWPASKSDGHSTDANSVPEGALLQLDPTVSCDTLSVTWWEKVLCRTLQRYGAYVRDKGGAFQVYAEDARNRSRDWSITTGRYAYFSTAFPFSRLRVVKPRTQW